MRCVVCNLNQGGGQGSITCKKECRDKFNANQSLYITTGDSYEQGDVLDESY